MSRYIADSYLYRAIGADINGRCGKCTKNRTDCMGKSLSLMDICGIIDDAATPNLVEVVWCKDCRWWERDSQPRHHSDERPCIIVEMVTSPEWFCADGERREDEE